MKSPTLSRREKLLLGLLTSTLIFSASFSYAAVNSNKVDAIMKMINDGAMKFSDIPTTGQTQSERASYYAKVDAGLGDAVEMLAVVRNNIRSLMGLSPAYTADEVVGGIISGVLGGTTGGSTGGGNGNGGNGNNGGAQITSLCPAGQSYPDYVYTSGRREIKPFEPNRIYTIELNLKNLSTKGLSVGELPILSTFEAPGALVADKYITISKNPCDFSSNAKVFYTSVNDGWRYFSVNDTGRTGNGVINLTSGKWYINVKLSGPCGTPGLPAGSPNQNNCWPAFEIPGGVSPYIGVGEESSTPPAGSSAWGSASTISCPTSLSALRSSNSSTYDSSSNTSGYQYANVGSSTNPLYINIKDYTNTSDLSLPSSCTPGKKWITKSGTNSCSMFSCNGSVTTPPTLPPVTSSDLGIFANDPIPPPCPANTKVMNEILISGAPTSGAWIRRPWYQKGTLNGVNHVYRLTVYNPDTSIVGNKGDIRFSDSGQANAVAVKISPYPCDFPEVATDGYSIKNASACTSGDFSIGGSVSFDYEENKASGRVCHLKKGVTYYANVRSTDFPTNPGGTPTGYGGGYDLAMYGKLEKDSLAMYGIYDTFQKWEPQQNRNLSTEGNISSQDPETLRQKVVNDYKTTGKNSEKLTIPLFTNTIKPLDKTVSNAGCEIHVDSNVHASVTKFSRVVADMTSPANIYYVGGVTVRQAADFPLCPSGLSVGTYTSKMYALNESITELLATSNYPNGLCRYNDTKVMGMTMPVECKQLCERTLGGSFANGWCEPTPGGLFE